MKLNNATISINGVYLGEAKSVSLKRDGDGYKSIENIPRDFNGSGSFSMTGSDYNGFWSEMEEICKEFNKMKHDKRVCNRQKLYNKRLKRGLIK